jgi:hypothetical protein
VKRAATQGYSGLSRSSVLLTLHHSRRSDDPLIERVSDMAKRLGGDVFMRQRRILVAETWIASRKSPVLP